MVALTRIASQHSFGFVAIAFAICVVAGWLLAVLLRAAEESQGATRRRWQIGAALVAGLGVWTTHFIAMLGYRADLLLTYDGLRTSFSALTSVLAVGLPLALSASRTTLPSRVALGAASGVGIGAMHFAGMAAIEGCRQIIAMPAVVLACSVGALAMAAARGLPERLRGPSIVSVIVTLGVCGVHFISIAGVSVIPDAVSLGARSANVMLSIFTGTGAAVLFIGAILALLAARRFEAQEQAHTQILSTALHNMSNGLVFIDGQQRISLFNSRFLEQFGLKEADLQVGMPARAFLAKVSAVNAWSPVQQDQIRERITQRIRSNAPAKSEHVMQDGRILEVESRPVQGGGTVMTFDDVTSNRRAQQQISHMAFHDPLTGLANRRGLTMRMEAARPDDNSCHLLLIDLDRFKPVNDTFGHAVGDQLLVQVAGRLRAVLCEDDFVARIGGDELAVLLRADADEAMNTADGIVSTLGIPFLVNDIILSIGCSIGICGMHEANSAELFMQQTDIALYEAKRQGRGLAVRYRAGMMEAVNERNCLERDMRGALSRGEFHLVYQPLVSLKTNLVIGYEALIRWDHPVLGSISPGRFIPLAEETGQIVAIGEWILREACREAASWAGGLQISVNVSPVQLRSPLLMAHVTNALAASGLAPNRLEVELTETAMVEDGPIIAHMLSSLRAMGLRVAMDDFGTGFSSLAHLRDFPLDRIKIDRSFVSRAETDPNSLAVLTAIVQLGRALHIPTLAEGIETPSQLTLLREVGCDAVQGYLLGQPARTVGGPLAGPIGGQAQEKSAA
ncbi:bifunctional diguanylate cyclase/phosphodiesterase [Aureimonas ureilytica]|uniref:bifunctional diguanylate cyclase/phosphodiesterase n=1 Tax=Aureimonas ureilytica TaxID=401562 RepID=UPI00036A5A0D|nr:EAL domain-containing protein [Aureimonas ureilytica]